MNGTKIKLRKSSLRTRVALMIAATGAIVSLIAVIISMVVYSQKMNERNYELCAGVTGAMAAIIDADEVQGYLASGVKDDAYLETEKQLQLLRDSISDLEYVYVYRINEDGCHVVFDTDAPDVPGNELGDVVAFDDSFREHLPDLLAGRGIEPIVSNDQYGWLLSVYRPLENSDGICVAYAAADVSMYGVVNDQAAFAVRIALLALVATAIITGLAIVYTQKRLVAPVNALAKVTSDFAFSGGTGEANMQELTSLDIHTGDEIENLYSAVSKMVADVVRYVALLEEQSEDIRQKGAIIQQMQANVIMSFADMVESRDENTGDHIHRTAKYVRMLSEALKHDDRYGCLLTDEFIESLVRSAPLHDIGKVKIPDAILNKPGRLTPEEFSVIKTHTSVGGEILHRAFEGISGSNYLSEATDMALYHHERWDGGGYPEGRSGENIPLSARIMAVADVLDALTSKRSYKDAYSLERALTIIEEESGTHFDPALVEALIGIRDEISECMARAAEETSNASKR